MGQGASSEYLTPDSDRVRIEKSDIPDSFDGVHVSENVLARVGIQRPQSGDSEKLIESLHREREENGTLRRELQNLRNNLSSSPSSNGDTDFDFSLSRREEEKERKRIFNETVERVSARFFNESSQSGCSDDERNLLNCYAENYKKPLNCSILGTQFKNCVDEYRNRLIAGNS